MSENIVFNKGNLVVTDEAVYIGEHARLPLSAIRETVESVEQETKQRLPTQIEAEKQARRRFQTYKEENWLRAVERGYFSKLMWQKALGWAVWWLAKDLFWIGGSLILTLWLSGIYGF